MTRLLAAALLAATTITSASAKPARPGPGPGQGNGAPAAWKFDDQGWTLLGTQKVNGRRDRDTIMVGRYEGKFDELTLVVGDSDLELEDFVVYFADGQQFSPKLKHAFKEGARSRVINLPGNDRIIQKIELKYRNTPGGGAATMSVYGRDKRNNGRPGNGPNAGPPPMPPRPPAPAFDATGWTSLGTQTVNGRADRDTIRVGRYKGKFDQLTLVVTDSDLELKDLTIQFSNGQRWSPRLAHTFREGQRSRSIDLPGNDRTVARIELSYANLPGGGRAKVEVFGRDLGRAAPPPIVPITWDNKGWTLISKSTVDGWRDRDRIQVRAGKPFSELMFVASGSDLQLNNVVVTFGNNETFAMPGSVVFREGTRTNPIDLPGVLRQIKTIDLAYANIAGGGRASLEVWGRTKPQAQPTPPPPPPPRPTPPPPRATPPAPPAPAPGPVIRDHR